MWCKKKYFLKIHREKKNVCMKSFQSINLWFVAWTKRPIYNTIFFFWRSVDLFSDQKKKHKFKENRLNGLTSILSPFKIHLMKLFYNWICRFDRIMYHILIILTVFRCFTVNYKMFDNAINWKTADEQKKKKNWRFR